ncbi:MAG: tryptophan synthase subunit alpha, partial [Pseudomonadota bacterium]|nr:tryptophan synthase subunit alpha [Pseudomonadota bacterium]
DLPPEEDNELCNAIESADLSFIRLVTPTTNADRLNKILQKTSGFLYYVSIAGITGSKRPEINEVETAVHEIKTKTNIPIGVGFGIRTKEDIERVGSFADGVIVGSVLVDIIKNNEHESSVKDKIMKKVREFASAV